MRYVVENLNYHELTSLRLAEYIPHRTLVKLQGDNYYIPATIINMSLGRYDIFIRSNSQLNPTDLSEIYDAWELSIMDPGCYNRKTILNQSDLGEQFRSVALVFPSEEAYNHIDEILGGGLDLRNFLNQLQPLRVGSNIRYDANTIAIYAENGNDMDSIDIIFESRLDSIAQAHGDPLELIEFEGLDQANQFYCSRMRIPNNRIESRGSLNSMYMESIIANAQAVNGFDINVQQMMSQMYNLEYQSHNTLHNSGHIASNAIQSDIDSISEYYSDINTILGIADSIRGEHDFRLIINQKGERKLFIGNNGTYLSLDVEMKGLCSPGFHTIRRINNQMMNIYVPYSMIPRESLQADVPSIDSIIKKQSINSKTFKTEDQDPLFIKFAIADLLMTYGSAAIRSKFVECAQ